MVAKEEKYYFIPIEMISVLRDYAEKNNISIRYFPRTGEIPNSIINNSIEYTGLNNEFANTHYFGADDLIGIKMDKDELYSLLKNIMPKEEPKSIYED